MGGSVANTLSEASHSSAAGRVEHEYCLYTASGKAWATLCVMSRARACTYLPEILANDVISGTLVLDLERSDAIRYITVSVVGRIGTLALENNKLFDFLNISQAIYPYSGAACTSNDLYEAPGKPSGLYGLHSFPFRITLPHTITMDIDGSPQPFSLPPTFFESGIKTSIQYEIFCTIGRTRLKLDSRLGTMFGYTPLTRPSAPSPLRQKSYRDNQPLVGLRDARGWHSLAPVTVSRIADGLSVARCMLSLAVPLYYTRGSVVPLLMTVESADADLLERLADPAGVSVYLLRHVHHRTTTKIVTDMLDEAVWWTHGESQRDEFFVDVTASRARRVYRRTLHGEIHLPKTLHPNFIIRQFQLSYSVALQPWKCSGMSYPAAAADVGLDAPGNAPTGAPPSSMKASRLSGLWHWRQSVVEPVLPLGSVSPLDTQSPKSRKRSSSSPARPATGILSSITSIAHVHRSPTKETHTTNSRPNSRHGVASTRHDAASLASSPVKIATGLAKGPKPRSYAPEGRRAPSAQERGPFAAMLDMQAADVALWSSGKLVQIRT